eukprot:643412-Prymnesium_polylepis.1
MDGPRGRSPTAQGFRPPSGEISCPAVSGTSCLADSLSNTNRWHVSEALAVDDNTRDVWPAPAASLSGKKLATATLSRRLMVE